jgi:hypothetical protein
MPYCLLSKVSVLSIISLSFLEGITMVSLFLIIDTNIIINTLIIKYMERGVILPKCVIIFIITEMCNIGPEPY